MSKVVEFGKVIDFLDTFNPKRVGEGLAKKNEQALAKLFEKELDGLANVLNQDGRFGRSALYFNVDVTSSYKFKEKKTVFNIKITAVNSSNEPHPEFHLVSAGRRGILNDPNGGLVPIGENSDPSSYKAAYSSRDPNRPPALFHKHDNFPASGARTNTSLNIKSFGSRRKRDKDKIYFYQRGKQMGGWMPRKLYDALYNEFKNKKFFDMMSLELKIKQAGKSTIKMELIAVTDNLARF